MERWVGCLDVYKRQPVTGSAFRAVAPVSAVCAAFRTQPSAYPPEATKPDVAPVCGLSLIHILTQLGLFLPMVLVAAYAFLSIHLDGLSVLDFLSFVVSFYRCV